MYQQSRSLPPGNSLLPLVLCAFLLLTSCGPTTSSVSTTPTPRPTPTPTTAPTSTPTPAKQRHFQKGIVFPRWNNYSYGPGDSEWEESLSEMKTQTGAEWIEITVLFSQSSSGSVDIYADDATPTLASFISGARKAHAEGFKVFFSPLMHVRQEGGWAGTIAPAPPYQQQWFDNYWNILQPYISAAANNGVEQVSIGTELEWLQYNVSPSLWTQLLQRVRAIYKGKVTYNFNWPILQDDHFLPEWAKSPELTYIGISEYMPLIDTPQRLNAETMITLWRETIKPRLIRLATAAGKPVILTEIGYRNSPDPFYQSWAAESNAPEDPEQQADAYNAALTCIMDDPHIAGAYFWGWDDVGRFAIRGQPAAQVLFKWFSTMETQKGSEQS